MELRHLSNDKLFAMYKADLILRIRKQKNLKNILNFLNRFKIICVNFRLAENYARVSYLNTMA